MSNFFFYYLKASLSLKYGLRAIFKLQTFSNFFHFSELLGRSKYKYYTFFRRYQGTRYRQGPRDLTYRVSQKKSGICGKLSYRASERLQRSLEISRTSSMRKREWSPQKSAKFKKYRVSQKKLGFVENGQCGPQA